MKHQLDILCSCPWDVLIVLDACRADCFGALASNAGVPGPEAVRSPAVCTARWVARVGPILADMGVLYFTANPVVDRECRKLGLELELVSVWQSQWGRFTEQGIPSVHPLSVNGIVSGYRQLGLLDGRRAVVHYLQPHSPYIGSPPLAVARWGTSGHDFGRACHRLHRPDRLVKRHALDAGLLRRAYEGNLRLVWHAARLLAREMAGTVVVTADHGECLCEPEVDGNFGHECHWQYPALYEVPWLVVSETDGGDESASIHAKLQALGYAT